VRAVEPISKILRDSLDNTPGQEWIVDVVQYAIYAGFTVRRVPFVSRFDNCIECECPVPLDHYVFTYIGDESHVLCFECVEAGYILDKGKQPPALLEKYRDTGEAL
jgi:hypothetical protein